MLSATDPEKTYLVLCNPWGSSTEHICDCEGYRYRGRCSHQERADMEVCRWSALGDTEMQTIEQRNENVCPRCGGSTKMEISL